MTQEHLSHGKALKVHLLMKGRKAVWVNPYQLISAEVSSVPMFLGKSVLRKEARDEREPGGAGMAISHPRVSVGSPKLSHHERLFVFAVKWEKSDE